MTSCGRCFSGTSLASLKDLIMTLYRCHLGRSRASPLAHPPPTPAASFPPGPGQSGVTGQTLQSGTSEPLGADQTEESRLFCFFKHVSSRSVSLSAPAGLSFSGTPRQIKVIFTPILKGPRGLGAAHVVIISNCRLWLEGLSSHRSKIRLR